MGRRQHTPVEADSAPVYIPAPPSDEEKYSYFQKPKPWIFAWIFVSALGILYGYVMVALKSPLTTPALLALPIMVMPVLVNFWLRSHRPRLTLDQHRSVLAKYRPDPGDTVDIWVPICGEPIPVLRNTCRTVAALQWHAPVMRYLLDDGDPRPEVEAMALEFGFVYVRRRDAPPGREPREGERGWLKKAGNMINAFEMSMGRFGVVFDADFAPRPDFLKETVPYMQAYPRTGIVQTAQYFDISPWMNYVQRGAGSLQEVFFRWIQPARDVWRAAICAGTNVVYRRDAVESVGGFARVPLGEDVNSGVKLWTGGWETRYLPLALAKGVAPDTWSAITNQQQRWCRSSMLLMTEKHFRDAKFNWQQRMAFWAAFFYYMASAGLLLTAPFPTLTMLWFFPDKVLPHNYLPMIPALLATLLIFPMMARGWRPEIFRLCMINSACHVIAIGDALRAKVQEWVPTGAVSKQPKAKKKGAPERVSRLLRAWVIVVQLLLWSGLALRLPEYGIGTLWATALLAAVQLYMVAPLLLPSYGIRESTPPIEATDRGSVVAEAERAWSIMRSAAAVSRPAVPAQAPNRPAAAPAMARPMAPAQAVGRPAMPAPAMPAPAMARPAQAMPASAMARPTQAMPAPVPARPVAPAMGRPVVPAQAAARPADAEWGAQAPAWRAAASGYTQQEAVHQDPQRGHNGAHPGYQHSGDVGYRQGGDFGHQRGGAGYQQGGAGQHGGDAGYQRGAPGQHGGVPGQHGGVPSQHGGDAGYQRGAVPSQHGGAPSQHGGDAGYQRGAAPSQHGGAPSQHGGDAGYQRGAVPSQRGAAPGQSGGDAGYQRGAAASQHGAAPGQHGAAPGQHGAAPGQHGAAPGQHGAAPGQHGAAPGQHGAAPSQHGGAPSQRGGDTGYQHGGAPAQHGGGPGYHHDGDTGYRHGGHHGAHPGHRPAQPAHNGHTQPAQAAGWQRGTTRPPAQRQPHEDETHPDPHRQPEPPHHLERAW